jgi:hypothetical protein
VSFLGIRHAPKSEHNITTIDKLLTWWLKKMLTNGKKYIDEKFVHLGKMGPKISLLIAQMKDDNREKMGFCINLKKIEQG